MSNVYVRLAGDEKARSRKLARKGTRLLESLIPLLPLNEETPAIGRLRPLVAAPPLEPTAPAKRVRLRRYKPKNDREWTALQNLKITWGNRKSQQEFYRVIQGHVALIGERYSQLRKRKNVRTVQYLRRNAKRCRDFAVKIETSRPKGLLLQLPPTRELLAYAQSLESIVESIVARKKERVLRHNTHKETREILDLLQFVRNITGKPHHMDLAVLLRGATGDQGITGRRIGSLWRSHNGKRRRLKSLSWVHVPSRRTAPASPLVPRSPE